MFEIKDWISQARELFNQTPQPLSTQVGERFFEVVPSEDGLQIGDEIKPDASAQWPYPEAVKLRTVTGIIELVEQKLDEMTLEATRFAVHVRDANTVALISLDADKFGRRREWAVAKNEDSNPFPFDEYMNSEAFLIKLQAGFLPTDYVIALQKLASNLTSDTSIQVQDDGFSQKVIFKGGDVQTGFTDVPKRVPLLAYRTFREIDPIQSEFTVRLRAVKDNVPQIALLQVDADKWKYDTVRVLHTYLTNRLPKDTPVIA